jgi:glucuronoarabinoxylan endo-1,4-beta-xylanase
MKRIFLLVAALTTAAVGATVSIDETARYQTIEGIGAFGAADAWWKGLTSYYNKAFLDLVVGDLGISMSRNEYYPVEDLSNSFSQQVPYLQALKAKAAALGQEMKFIATYWSPPASFKDNGSTVNGGHVKPSMYAALATYCVETVRRYQSEAGIDLCALSFANEPRFVETYNSCVWTEAEYRDFVKVVGPRFAQEGITTKLFGPEDMLDRFTPYAGYINADPAAKPYLGAVAVQRWSRRARRRRVLRRASR